MARKKKNKQSKKEEDFDEDFDDEELEEDIEEEKPKKEKKKKEGTTIKWVIGFVILLLILFYIRHNSLDAGTEIEEPATTDEQATAEESSDLLEKTDDTQLTPTEKEDGKITADTEQPTGKVDDELKETTENAVNEESVSVADETNEEKEFLSEEELAIDVSNTPQLLSDVKCEKDEENGNSYISLKLTNVGEENFMISHKGVSKNYNTYFSIRSLVDNNPGCNQEELTPGESTTCTKIGLDTAPFVNVKGINRLSIQAPGQTEALLIECP